MDFRDSTEWNAWAIDEEGQTVTLHVTGLVKITAANHMPEIPEASLQGVEPDILVLDLVVVVVGQQGTGSVGFRKAKFSKKTVKGRYGSVHIRSEGVIIARLPIEERGFAG